MRVKRYQEGHIHLPPGSMSYDTGIPIAEKEANTYVDGTVHINMTRKTGPKPILSKEDTYLHILGVVMAQRFSLKSGLKRFGNEGKKAVSKEFTDAGTSCFWLILVFQI